MGDQRHIQAEHYVQVRDGSVPSASLAMKIFDHLAAVCPECASAWRQLAGLRDDLAAQVQKETAPYDAARLGRSTPVPAASSPGAEETPDHHLPYLSREAREEDREIQRLRSIRRYARRQTWKLLCVPPHRRAARIDRGNTLFRSLAVAEHMIERCRGLIHSDPAEAESIAALVPGVLDRVPGGPAASDKAEIRALAAAWRANALRVAGDLPAADRAFAELRARAARDPVEDVAMVAELFSLEASLRIGQRRTREAEELLDQAALLLRYTGDAEALARVLVNKGNLLVSLDRSEQALLAYEAVPHLESTPDTAWTRGALANGQVMALCQLGRPGEAREVLEAHLGAFEDCPEPHAAVAVRNLYGRIALGEGRYAAAEEAFAGCREGFLALGRRYDAALASLDLAEVYLQEGRLGELRGIARELAPVFQACQVPRETLATLRLFFDAATAECLTVKCLDSLRQVLRREP